MPTWTWVTKVRMAALELALEEIYHLLFEHSIPRFTIYIECAHRSPAADREEQLDDVWVSWILHLESKMWDRSFPFYLESPFTFVCVSWRLSSHLLYGGERRRRPSIMVNCSCDREEYQNRVFSGCRSITPILVLERRRRTKYVKYCASRGTENMTTRFTCLNPKTTVLL